ncbi:MAG: hypothetical protein AAFO61_09465, partial [Pseudomonadota bacterium]
MTDKPKEGGFFKRLFKFGKKDEVAEEAVAEPKIADLQPVEDETSSIALAESENTPVAAHADAAANVIADGEAGADLDDAPGITPLAEKASEAPSAEEVDQKAAAERALAEAEARRATDIPQPEPEAELSATVDESDG